MELIFLGTGAGVPSKERNVSAIALDLLQEENSIWLFDCGESTQHQILHTSIKPRKITKIFITHMHGDHIFGLPGLLSSRSFQGGDELLTVYGPAGIRAYIETSLKTSGSRLSYPLSIVEIPEGEILDERNFRVTAGKLDHGIPSYGYRVEEKDRPGELLVERLLEKGVAPGPIYQQIKENDVTITEDGQRICRKDVIGPDKKGRVLSILGDTRFSPAHAFLASDADVLVHEATFGEEKTELARDYFHSTTVQAAELARKSNASKLILTHISSRYQIKDNQQLLAEARAIFPNTELANDFYRLSINHQR